MTPESQAEEPNMAGFISALPTILWHRRWLIIIPAVLALIGAIVAAVVMHPVYESRATVLIESQQLPDELIGTPGGGDINDAIGQRVARARERVLSRMDLIRMIRTYNLYPEQQRTSPLSAIVDKMRSDTVIQAVSNDIQISSNRRNGLNTIAIMVGFRYDDPQKAQIVAQQYVDHFLEADASTQASQATDAVNFLTEQARDLQSRIGDVENRMTQIQSANGMVLALGQSTGDRAADVSRIDSDIAGLQAENARLAGSVGAAAPDSAVTAAEAQLRVAQARYSDSHPDVIAARAQLAAARQAAASTPAAVNPAANQMAANRAQISSLQRAREMLSSQSANIASAQSRAPAIAAQIAQLDKQADTLREQYRGIGLKLQAAQIQARMESEQKGERLTLADPPVVPDTPIRPDRPLIIAGGLVGGLGLGLALALLVELVLRPIRGINSLKQAAGEAPLAVIPDFDQKPNWVVRMLERRTRRKLARA
jgi:polysaccharide biosynthesis transport protein